MITPIEADRRATSARRGEARAIARVPVTVRTMRETTYGQVLDVSATGARLFMDSATDLGGEVMVRWLGHDVCADVMWSRQYECGVQFSHPLSRDVLAELNAALAGATQSQAAPEPPAPVPAARVARRTFATLTAFRTSPRRKQAL